MCFNSELFGECAFRISIHLPRETEDSARLVTRAEVGGAVTARGSLSRSSVRGRSGRTRAETGSSVARNVCPKADVPAGAAASVLPRPTASTYIGEAPEGHRR